jgi:hypothetical protein
LSLSGNIQLNIRSQLGLLLSQLSIKTRLSLRSLNLESQNVGLQLKNFVLYLADLERLPCC